MSFWGDRFVNLGSVPELERQQLLEAYALVVRRAIDSQVAGALSRGGVLYLPPGGSRGGLWPVDVSTELRLPPGVTLWLAPGARLLPLRAVPPPPGAQAVLRVEGGFRAPMGPCLATPALASRWLDRPMSASQVGRVQLLGARLERVHPEWWGGGAGDPELDTQALEAAVIAAWYDRERDTPPRPPLAVEIVAPLVVRRPVLVMPRASAAGVMVLRGTMPPRAAPSLRASEDFEGTALVVALRHASVSLEGVTLDGATAAGDSVADACVALEGQTQGARVGATLTDCALYGARLTALTWGTESMPARRDTRLALEGCTIEAPRVGLRLRGEDASEVLVRGCRLEGAARALVDVRGGALSVAHCAFASAPRSDKVAMDLLDPKLPAGGVDLVVAGAGTTVTMDHCASSSDTVVWGVASWTRGGVSVEVTSLRHTPDAASQRALPPAIQVDGGAWGASRLVLDACVFDRPAGATHAPAVRVRDNDCVVANLGVHPRVPNEEARVEAVRVDVPVRQSVDVARRAQS